MILGDGGVLLRKHSRIVTEKEKSREKDQIEYASQSKYKR
jgi:hypothetical protein